MSLARRLNVYDFNIVQAAFVSGVQNYDEVVQLAQQEGDSDLGAARVHRDPHYQERIDTIIEAQNIALDASSRRRDLRRRDEDIKKLVNRP